MSNIKVKFKNGTIRIYGDPYEYDHIMLAANKLRIGEVDPTRRVKFRRACKRCAKTVRKFFRCLSFALFGDCDDYGNIKVRKIR